MSTRGNRWCPSASSPKLPLPNLRKPAARLCTVVVLPTPPLWFTKARTSRNLSILYKVFSVNNLCLLIEKTLFPNHVANLRIIIDITKHFPTFIRLFIDLFVYLFIYICISCLICVCIDLCMYSLLCACIHCLLCVFIDLFVYWCVYLYMYWFVS